jgi:hypothetical protein
VPAPTVSHVWVNPPSQARQALWDLQSSVGSVDMNLPVGFWKGSPSSSPKTTKKQEKLNIAILVGGAEAGICPPEGNILLDLNPGARLAAETRCEFGPQAYRLPSYLTSATFVFAVFITFPQEY